LASLLASIGVRRVLPLVVHVDRIASSILFERAAPGAPGVLAFL